MAMGTPLVDSRLNNSSQFNVRVNANRIIMSDIDWYQKPPGSCSSHLLNPARDRNMQIRRDPYSLESTRLDPRNRGFTRVARGEQPISERLGINKYGVKWKVIAFVD